MNLRLEEGAQELGKRGRAPWGRERGEKNMPAHMTNIRAQEMDFTEDSQQ